MNNEHMFEVIILENGPVHIRGIFSFKDSSGNTSSEHKELFLCRCGMSQNKPFCDDSHKKTGTRS